MSGLRRICVTAVKLLNAESLSRTRGRPRNAGIAPATDKDTQAKSIADLAAGLAAKHGKRNTLRELAEPPLIWAGKQAVDTPSQRAVLSQLAWHGKDGMPYPSIQLLSKECALSERGVRYAIAGLIQLGHITEKWKDGRHNVYRLNVPYKDQVVVSMRNKYRQ